MILSINNKILGRILVNIVAVGSYTIVSVSFIFSLGRISSFNLLRKLATYNLIYGMILRNKRHMMGHMMALSSKYKMLHFKHSYSTVILNVLQL